MNNYITEKIEELLCSSSDTIHIDYNAIHEDKYLAVSEIKDYLQKNNLQEFFNVILLKNDIIIKELSSNDKKRISKSKQKFYLDEIYNFDLEDSPVYVGD